MISSDSWSTNRFTTEGAVAFRSLGLVTVGAAFIQIVLGAVMRHENAGLIIFDFPLSYGRLVPEFYEWRVGLNYAHRVGALLVLILALLFAFKALRSSSESWIRTPAIILLLAVLTQVTLGAFSVWTRLQPVVTSFHVIGGALVLSSSLVLTLRLYRLNRTLGA